MKTREIFLIFVAFTLLFLIFCAVTLTGIDSDKLMIKPDPQLCGGSQTAGTNEMFIHSSIQNLEKVALQSKSNRASLTASSHLTNNRPDKPKMDLRSASYRIAHSDIKDRLTPIESKGRVYFENTTGIEACDSNDGGESDAIE